MLRTLTQVWKTKELRKSIGFVLLMLVVFRVMAHIPIPGVDRFALQDFFARNDILGFLNVFSGGAMNTFSLAALGVGPYITSSIIFQLLAMIVPAVEEMQKDGQAGKEKITRWTRMGTVPLAVLQAYAIVQLLKQSGTGIIPATVAPFDLALMIITMATGSLLLTWIGEIISEQKVGNGISIMIFAGIIAQLPTALQQVFVTFDPSQVMTLVMYAVLGIVTIAGVVFITEGQRNIPVTYAKRMRGAKMYGGSETFLPLRVNMAGVIPIIFAISIVLFPPMIAQFFLQAKTSWVANAATTVIALFQDQLFYGIAFFLLVFIFTYFYTAIIFHPDQVAENLQKQGGYIPGVRPGQPTAEHIQRTINRIMPAGAAFLATIAVLPTVVQNFTGTQALAVGGTGMLIVVSVIIEIVNQVNAQLAMREYEYV
jgi:preprotein translocase subunit SecY